MIPVVSIAGVVSFFHYFFLASKFCCISTHILQPFTGFSYLPHASADYHSHKLWSSKAQQVGFWRLVCSLMSWHFWLQSENPATLPKPTKIGHQARSTQYKDISLSFLQSLARNSEYCKTANSVLCPDLSEQPPFSSEANVNNRFHEDIWKSAAVKLFVSTGRDRPGNIWITSHIKCHSSVMVGEILSIILLLQITGPISSTKQALYTFNLRAIQIQ